jgi:hypothetical protein
MLLCLSNLGQLLAHTFQFAYSHMCCNRSSKRAGKKHQQLAPPSPDLMIPPPEQFTPRVKAPPPPPPPRLTPPRRRQRPLTPEVRQLLVECAEYSLAHGGSAEPATQRLLQDLQLQQSPAHEALLHTHQPHESAAEEDEDDEALGTSSYRCATRLIEL